GSADRDERRNEYLPAVDQCGEHGLVLGPDALEAALEGTLEYGKRSLTVAVLTQQVHRERGHQSSREHVGRDHGEHDGFGQRDEQKLRDPAQKEHREKDNTNAERGDKRRNGDLRRAFEDGGLQV